MKPGGVVPVLLLAANFLNAQVLSPNTNLNAREEQIIAATKPAAQPHFNGAMVVGIRPNTPFLHSLAVSGERPMSFGAKNLPASLSLDSKTGIIIGSLPKAGEYRFKATAKNPAGKAETEFKIICDNTLALTPPMGWNSYDAFGDSVVESEVLSNAFWLKEHLQPLGWDNVVVDFRWYDRLADGVRVQNPDGVTIDESGRCVPPTNRFPSAVPLCGSAGFKPLADKIHALGLKFGIHIMRGIPRQAVEKNLPIAGSKFTAAQAVLSEGDANRTCVWNRDMFGVDAATEAGRAWYASIARQYADWGVDYIKCDDIANLQRGRFYDAAEIEALSTALKNSGRSIILSLSPGATPVNAGPHVKQFANLWRISGDFWDRWPDLRASFGLLDKWSRHTRRGAWPDADMLPLGRIGIRAERGDDRTTRFTRDEQRTLMSLWSIARSPLMFGGDLPSNDDFTLSLLTNDEVLATDQNATSSRQLFQRGDQVAWTSEVLFSDGRYLAVFNVGDQASMEIRVNWSELGLPATCAVRDLWEKKDLGRVKDGYTFKIPPHGSGLYRVR